MNELNGHEHDRITLSPADAAAVDALLDPTEVAANVDPARKDRATAWLKSLDAVSVPETRGELAQRTLQAVRDAERMKIPARAVAPAEAPAASPRWRRRLTEFGAMAVAAMLFVAVLLAGLNQAKQSQIRVACVANMKNISNAFNTYASTAGAGELPMVAIPSNHNWLHGSPDGAHDNGAHLLPLVTAGYVTNAALLCPGTPAASSTRKIANASLDIGTIGYSYRNMYGADKPRWDGSAATIVLTDRNPLFADSAPRPSANINSENHDSHGNNVLHADGSVTWATSPNIGPANDNIWTIGSGNDRLLSYNGTETPASLADVIVCP